VENQQKEEDVVELAAVRAAAEPQTHGNLHTLWQNRP
jgi:hypothetical protein